MQSAQVFSFHGGIHPPENKAQSLQLPLGRPSLPAELVLPLGQHIGQNSRVIVAPGEQVLKGQTIAINNGFLSSFLHAPTSGTIQAIEERPIAHPSGLSDQCIILVPDGQDAWQERSPLTDWQHLPHMDVLTYLGEMGIVGMGGAGFPTQVKLQGAHKHTIKHFIINAAECEPYITADDMLIREKTEQLVLGIEVLQHLVQAERVVIGIEDNKPTAIEALKKTLTLRNSNIQLAVVPTKYPSGGEKQLIQLLTGLEVPSGQYPADVGVLCQNVGTCVAVHDAIFLGQPLISRFTTLTGDALQAPQNVEVLLGTPIHHLLDYASAEQTRIQRLIMGGPMMGFTLDNQESPIVKTSNCILAASAEELPEPEPEQACIRCGMCEQACPASLLPQQLLWFSKSQELEKAEHYNLFDCIECGACSYVCPSSIPLVQYYRHSKSAIRENREATLKSDIAKQRFEARKARQEAEIAEKEAKRIARQQAANKSAEKPAEKKKAKPAPNPTATPVNEDTKKLKVDIAIAKTKLKKLEKQLLTAQESEHVEDIKALELQVNESKKQLAQLEEELAKLTPSAEKPTSAAQTSSKPAVNEAFKKAKVDVALLGVKLKKLSKQAEQAPEDASLQKQVNELQTELDKAQQRLQELTPQESQAQTAPTGGNNQDALKKLKIDAAIAKAAVKKVEKAVKKAEEIQSPELATLRQQLKEAQQRAADLDKALTQPNLEQAESAQSQTKPTEDPEAVKKRKVDLAIAKAGIKKAEKNIALLKEQGQNDEQIATSEWPAKLAQAQSKLAELEAGSQTVPAPTKAEPAEVKPAGKDAGKKLKIDLAVAKASIKKAEKNIALLKEQGQNDEQIATSEWPAKLAQAQSKLAELEAGNQTAPAPTKAEPAEATLADKDAQKKLKIDLAVAKAGIKKAEKNIALLKEQGQNEEQIAASEWPAKLAQAQSKLAELEAGTQTAPAPTKAEPAETKPADKDAEKKLKIDLAIAKASIKKAEKNIALLKEQGHDEAHIEASQWPEKLAEAQAKLAQLTQSKEN
ncbi:electron transport complex subunit RsxC [Marinomonas epiphytica]